MSLLSRKKQTDLWVHLGFLALFALAFILFRERLFADSAYYIARVIHEESFWVEHRRYPLILSQWLPLLAVKLHLPLRVVLVLYSLGHVLFFYLLFLVARYMLNNREAGYFLLLLQTLGLLHGFFTPMFELYYGAGLLVLYGVLLIERNMQGKWLLLALTLQIPILLSHPFAIILIIYTWGLHYLGDRKTPISTYLIFGGLLILILLFKAATATEYEQGKSALVLNRLRNGTYEYLFDPKYLAQLIFFLLRYYLDLLLIWLGTLIYFLWRKEWPFAGWIAICFLAQLLLIQLYEPGFQHTRYQEQVYFPLIFLAAGPMFFSIIRRWQVQKRPWFYGFVLMLFFIRLVAISESSESFTQRVEEMNRLIEKASVESGSKFFLPEKQWDTDIIEPNWSLSIETMLLSGLKDPSRSISICTDFDLAFEENRQRLGPDQFLFRRWEIFEDKKVNPRYFQLRNGGYRGIVE